VASGVALGMLHRAMHFLLHQRTAMAIKMASGRGALFLIVDFVIYHNRSLITCNSQYKIMPKHIINIHYIIILLVFYELPPMTRDAVLATIVTGRRAQI
jgi:hypothetical protein